MAADAAVGTHPTGMHTCWAFNFNDKMGRVNITKGRLKAENTMSKIAVNELALSLKLSIRPHIILDKTEQTFMLKVP